MMATANRRRRIRVILSALFVLLGTLALVPGAGAAGTVPVVGTVRVDPAVGTAAQNNIRLLTTSTGSPVGCPSSTARYTVSVSGPGAWAQGVAFDSGGTTAGIEVEAPLSPTFAARATALGEPLVAGRYDITVTCASRLSQPLASFVGTIWFTDADHYQSSDPDTTTTLTAVALEDEPAGRAELGRPVTLTASVTPRTATGSVQFKETLNDAPLPYGSPVRVVDGQARLVVSSFTFGLHLMSATFIPDNPKRFAGSSTPTPELAFVVAKPVPPEVADGPRVTGSPAVGSLLTCAAVTVRATGTSYAWLRAGSPIAGATRRTYTPTTNDRGQPLACRITAENAGGVASELSTSVTVGGAG